MVEVDDVAEVDDSDGSGATRKARGDNTWRRIVDRHREPFTNVEANLGCRTQLRWWNPHGRERIEDGIDSDATCEEVIRNRRDGNARRGDVLQTNEMEIQHPFFGLFELVLAMN